jgi:hypothetical protein
MKYFKYILLAIIVVFAFSSCEDYLDVNPKTEVKSEILLSDEQGFMDALTGAYISMKKESLYGKSMTMTTMEQLLSNWDYNVNTVESKLAYFELDDSNIEARFSAIYGSAYNVIAQVNTILEVIDQKNAKGVFKTPGMYEMIKGECLAIRAYCHFDLLRVFGPVPSQIGTEPVLPYMKIVTKSLQPHVSVNQFKIDLMNDVSQAEMLLRNDPITKFSVYVLRNGGAGFNPSTNYFMYRDVRFNYFAAIALKARINLWFGEKHDAFNAALEVINALDPGDTKKFPLGNAANMNLKDFALSNENIMGLYVFNLPDIYSNAWNNQKLFVKGNNDVIVKNQLYGNTGTDIREVNLWERVTTDVASYYSLRKYKYGVTDAPVKDVKMIPLIRVSEMYLIAAECANTPESANEYWNSFRIARNLNLMDLPTESVSAELEIIKEYRKEFIGEGQAFYAYKRLNINRSDILWVPATVSVKYQIPLPKTELVTGK